MLLDIIYLRRKYILKLKQTHSTKARIPNVVNRIPAAAIKERADVVTLVKGRQDAYRTRIVGDV